MSGNTISITMSADDRDVIDSFRDQNSQIIRNQEALRKMGTTGKKATQDTTTGLNKAKGAALGVASSVGLITSGVGLATAAVQVLVAEYENLLQRQQAAARSQIDTATAKKQAITNAQGTAPEEVEAAVNRISGATGTTPRDAALALSSAASAKGKLPFAAAEEATREALRLTADMPEAQEAFAGVALDIRNLNPKASAKDALGFSLALGANARVVNPADIAANLIPGAIDIARNGSTLRNGGAVGAAISFGSSDTSGRTSRTAGTALDVQLREAFPEIKGIGSQIDFLQNNPEAKKAFLEGGEFNGRKIKPASFEKKTLGAIESLLTAGSDVDQTFRNAQKNLPELIGSGKLYDARIEEIDSAQSQQAARLDRGYKALTDRAKNSDLGGALAAVNREKLVELFASHGDGVIANWRTNRQYNYLTNDGTENQVGASISIIEERLADKYGPNRTTLHPDQPLTEKEQDRQSGLIEMLAVLREIQKNTSTGNQNAAPQEVMVVNGPDQNRGKRPRQPKAAENNRN